MISGDVIIIRMSFLPTTKRSLVHTTMFISLSQPLETEHDREEIEKLSVDPCMKMSVRVLPCATASIIPAILRSQSKHPPVHAKHKLIDKEMMPLCFRWKVAAFADRDGILSRYLQGTQAKPRGQQIHESL